MSGPISGQYASAKIGASCVAEANGWSLSRECTVHEFATCQTPSDGGMGAIAGRRKHGGTMKGLYDPTNKVDDYFDEGDTVTLKLYVDATNYYQGSAVIEKLDIPDVDVKDGAPVEWNASFKANGLFTYH